MRVMITGGGTGGHAFPAVAVYEELSRRDPRLAVQWVGRSSGIEARICRDLSIPFRSLPVEGWPRRRTPRKLWVAVKMAWSLMRAWLMIRRFQPDLVFGVGGYVSLPLMYAAQRMDIKTAVHEQNSALGVANRLLAPRADRVFLSYADTKGAYPEDRARVVGNPVREAFNQPPGREEACAAFNLEPDVPVVLVSGGSQGARGVNRSVGEALRSFDASSLQLLWMTGPDGAADARKAAEQAACSVQVFPFIKEMATACAAADLIVSRAGASSTAEIACLGKPSILIPFPHATDNHQERNAREIEKAGAARVLLESDCDGAVLAEAIQELLRDPGALDDMANASHGLARPGAAAAIVEEVLELLFGSADKGPVGD